MEAPHKEQELIALVSVLVFSRVPTVRLLKYSKPVKMDQKKNHAKMRANLSGQNQIAHVIVVN